MVADASVSDDVGFKKSNTCYNCYYTSDGKRSGYKLEDLIFQVIDEAEIELKPVEIAQKIYYPNKPTPGQRSSVRVLCTKLLQRGLVMQPYPGAYCNKITYGMRFYSLRVHNLRFHSHLTFKVKHEVVEEFVEGVKIHVCFGSERRQVTGYIANDVPGMEKATCMFALNRLFDIIEGRLGFELRDLDLTTFELNKDYANVRLDGVACMTKKTLYGFIERTYQKEENLVRREVKVSSPMSVNKFEEALDKGLVGLDSVQHFSELSRAVVGVGDALKFTNNRLLQLESLAAGMSKAQFSVLDLLQNLTASNSNSASAANDNGCSSVVGGKDDYVT